jgi:hypothetical protein
MCLPDTSRRSPRARRSLLSEERYEITSSLSDGERVVLEVTWTGTLAVPLGKLAQGTALKARCSMHFELRDGKIAGQCNSDGLDPWLDHGIGQSC